MESRELLPPEELKTMVRSTVEGAYNNGDLSSLSSLYASDVVYHRPPLPDIEGLGTLREYIADISRAFSDIHYTIRSIILEGDTYAELWAFQGTHTGQSPALPVPARGRQVSITGSTLGLWAGGKIVEEWSYVDWLGLFRQLGVIPPMG